MGQAASKAAAKVTSSARAGTSAAAAGTKVDRITGFTHGTGGESPQEREQRVFLEQQQGDAPKEMPPDLLKFLTDVGPVQKREQVKKPSSKPSPAVASQLLSPDITAQPRKPESNRRTENMRLAKNVAGFETVRNTNFSRQIDEEEDVGVDVVQLFGLLQNEISVEQSLQDVNDDDKHKKEQIANIKQALKFIELPTLLQDEDDSYVGVWADRKDDLMKLHRGMRDLPKERVQLAVEDLWDQQQIENKKQQPQK